MEDTLRGDATGTRHEYLAFILRVEVDQIAAVHEVAFHAESTSQSGLFVTGEDTLDGAVLNIVRVKDCQFDGIADTIVGSERGSLGLHPLTVNVSLDGVVQEVNLMVHEFVAHHIHVTLQDHRLQVLIALGARFADQHVAGFVHLGL